MSEPTCIQCEITEAEFSLPPNNLNSYFMVKTSNENEYCCSRCLDLSYMMVEFEESEHVPGKFIAEI